MNSSDPFLQVADHALRSLFAKPHAARPCPQAPVSLEADGRESSQALEPAQRSHAAGLMRVNHVGEVCAQALYSGQAFATKNPALKEMFLHAAAQETDHLAWTAQRLEALGARSSLLNPLWYAGSFALGALASRLGDAVSLGFVVETERQVEAHLQGHLSTAPEGLPAQDHASRAIVQQMQADEVAHAQQAQAMGALELPLPVKSLMAGVAKLMTSTAYRL